MRELRNVVERLLLLADGPVDRGGGAAGAAARAPRTARSRAGVRFDGPLAERVDSFEREQILAELKRHSQRMTDTAKALGLERSHLYKKCQALGIDLRASAQRGRGTKGRTFDWARVQLRYLRSTMAKFFGGLVTGVVLVILTVILLFAALLRFREKPPQIADNSVLLMRLNGEIPEKPPVELPDFLDGNSRRSPSPASG